ncbi:MAG: DUF89 family protein [Candidatus Omnitrophota bacterium]|jgi:uncharacterized protein with ATP-grasp and redox domains|nr:MAG: DUF89 family protein [Candidatus Omnitrophota bacterium]
MIVNPSCIPCITNQVDRLIRLTIDDESHADAIRKLLNELIGEKVAGEFSPPEIAQMVYAMITSHTGIADPFSAEKEMSNREALELYPVFSEYVAKADDPVAAGVKLAALGNIIDLAILGHVPDADSILQEAEHAEFRIDEFGRFTEDLRRAKTLLYILDNSGEIVLDMLLIETLLDRYPGLEITAVTRSGPIINDVTLDDARAVGLDKIVKVISPGGDAIPGISPVRTPEFAGIFGESDIVIAKGQGNFESRLLNRPVYHLFKIKCGVVAEFTGYPENSLIFYYRSGADEE